MQEKTHKISDLPTAGTAQERRRLCGHYTRLMEELRVEDPQSFFDYLKKEPAMFDELVQRVGSRIPTF